MLVRSHLPGSRIGSSVMHVGLCRSLLTSVDVKGRVGWILSFASPENSSHVVFWLVSAVPNLME